MEHTDPVPSSLHQFADPSSEHASTHSGRVPYRGAMRVSDVRLEELDTQGFTIVEGFLGSDELAAAQDQLWHTFPRPEEFFADPSAFAHLAKGQFAGLKLFPAPGWALNRLATHPDLVDAAERFLGSADLELYKIEVWAKYSGAVDYDQPHHRDFGNHSMVVPRDDGAGRQLTTFVLLSDVSEVDGPTKVVPLEHTRDVPMVPDDSVAGFGFSVPIGRFADVEVSVTGLAGTLFMYRTDVFHRGSNFGAPGRSRFAMLIDFQVRGPSWAGKMSWPNTANSPHWVELIERATVRERDLFGFPKPGDEYWNSQTLRDVGRRYPKMDMSPYGTSEPSARVVRPGDDTCADERRPD